MKEPIRVAVIDNHRLFRDGVITTLEETTYFKVVAVGESGSHAVRIASDILPEIMLLDLNMPEGGIESAREISAICPYVKTVMLTSCDGEENLAAINEAGVRLCIIKGVSAPALTEALRDVQRANEPMLEEVCNHCRRRERSVEHRDEREHRQPKGSTAGATSTIQSTRSDGHQIEQQEECILRRAFAARKNDAGSADEGENL